jgi:uncharacterized protein (TIGR00369 family)
MHDRIKQIFEHPLHQYMGVTDIKADQGEGFVSFQVVEHLLSPAGALHGGVLYTLCDVCAYVGLLSILDADQEAVTHDIHLSMMRSAKAGDRVTIGSRIVKKGGSLCFIDVSAMVAGDVVATARVTKSLIRLAG